MPTETVENYLKAILSLAPDGGPSGGQVPLGDLAHAVGVTPGTATTMVKKLARDKLARYQRYGGVALTPRGRRAALSVLRRHRIIETFLVQTLGMDWSEVHDEAERLEHALSDRLLEKLDAFLGRPASDPHGDPIPDNSGKLRTGSTNGRSHGAPARLPLPHCRPGSRVKLARVLDQRPDFLRFLDRHDLHIGAAVTLLTHEPGAGTITLRTSAGEVTLSEPAAAKLMVELMTE